MAFRKEEINAEEFWREYAEKTGEEVTGHWLGQYFSGWDEFKDIKSLWGLVIFTSGGFRFHHFPQHSWLFSIVSPSRTEKSREKTIFIPKERIKNMRILREESWWKRILNPLWPQLVISYTDENENEKQLFLEADFSHDKNKIEALEKTFT